MKIVAGCLICICLILIPITLSAAPISPVQALEQLRKGFIGMKDFSADIIQEKRLSIMKKKLVSTGIVHFKKPDLFYMELKPPHASKMVLRDASVEVFIPQDNSRQQITLPGDGGLKHWLGLLDQPIKSVPQGMSITAQRSGDIQTVTISPQKKGQIKTITITSGGDGRPKKLQIAERNGNYTSITFKNLRANIGLTEKDFKIE